MGLLFPIALGPHPEGRDGAVPFLHRNGLLPLLGHKVGIHQVVPTDTTRTRMPNQKCSIEQPTLGVPAAICMATRFRKLHLAGGNSAGDRLPSLKEKRK